MAAQLLARYHEEVLQPGRRTVDRATFAKESALNRHAYEKLRDQIRRDYGGQYVALAHGQVIGAANNFDAARALVEALQPVPEYYLVFPAEEEPAFDLVYDLAGGA